MVNLIENEPKTRVDSMRIVVHLKRHKFKV